MRKKGFIAGVLILAMLLMGTGYACLTNSIDIQAKVTTGDFHVGFESARLFKQFLGNEWIVDGGRDRREVLLSEAASLESGETADILTGRHPEAEIGTIYYDKINIDLSGFYPGYGVLYRVDVVNIGDIAAKLSSINKTVTANEDMQKMIGVSLSFINESAPNVFNTGLTPADRFTLGGKIFVRLSALKNITHPALITLGSGEEKDVFLGIAMDPTATMETQGETASFDIEFVWEQYNPAP